MKTAAPRRPGRAGFTLVEVSLALLVLSVGVLGAFALFPHGLAESRMASFETQASLFGEMVLRSYRALAVTQSWDALNTARIPVPGVEPGIWTGSEQTPWIEPGNVVRAYVNASKITAAVGGSGEVVDNALRYKLLIEDRVPGRVKKLTLYVWPGRFGTTADNEARLYVTAIYNGR